MKPDEANLTTTQTVERRWFDIRGAADYLSVKPRCIRELIWTGQLAYAQIGKRFIMDRVDLDKLAEKRKHSEPMNNRAKTV